MDTLKITTGARLHFGLLDTRPPFGGVGLMIEEPETVVQIEAATEDILSDLEVAGFASSAAGRETVQRISGVVRRFRTVTGRSDPMPARLAVLRRAAPHTGLGSGTQLAMAVAEALCHAAGTVVDSPVLAVEIAGRGLRSAVGIHGYWRGGLIYEMGSRQQRRERPPLNALVDCCPLPEDWRIVLYEPRVPAASIAGEDEKSRFSALPRPQAAQRAGLKMIVESQLIPAARSGDFAAFTEAVFQYNLVSGRFFAAAQGGAYHGEATAAWVRTLRGEGFYGVGQSSWGPTIFAFCEGDAHARVAIALSEGSEFRARSVRPLNTGRQLTTGT